VISPDCIGDKIEEGVLGEACVTFRGRREMHSRFWWGNLKGRDYLEVLGVGDRIILKWILNNHYLRIYAEQTQYLHAPVIILQHVSAAYADHHQVEVLQNHESRLCFYLMVASVRGRNML
jgi:hypothetical protein